MGELIEFPDRPAPWDREVVGTAPTDDAEITTVTLSCGHMVDVICYRPCTTMPCAQCIHDLLERHKQAPST